MRKLFDNLFDGIQICFVAIKICFVAFHSFDDQQQNE